MKRASRRHVAVLLAVAAISLPLVAFSQAKYPSRPVTLVLPAGAGTGVDIIGRLGAQKLSEVLGQPVVVENVVGASGVIGVQKVTRAKPDGYTLLFAFNQAITMNPHVVANLPYDPQKELAPISRFAASPFVWMVNAQVPVTTFPDLVAYAKSHPGKLAMGVTGFASAAYLGSQLLAYQTGAEVLPVNYAGNFSADLMSNVVQLSMSPAAQVPALVASGKVRALAQTGSRRAEGMPDVPTVKETVPGFVIDAWYAVWAPAGTPKEVVAALTTAWQSVASMPEVKERLAAMSAVAVGSTAEELNELSRTETKMWGDVVKARKIAPAQ
ncbi:tripartite-type tricarboxylate transporter receptor subunit TctC [Variovorax boronicumulans]|uniref:Bug family tripartite tricarboxylate transporter substrate binding protein n=1 Tax=Variovorax boronicumulans TaxID=436515 RepID=UPI0027874E7C|nr:tripartite tricarboxylate transporter substrate-binding protein [Variovorax boronicumulans]MDQ0036763.1 tripartite-type tricarboxylate transporter receptor subunit TctC [Variovorax boronicumulans]